MNSIETIIDKTNLTNEELDSLIKTINEQHAHTKQAKKVPQHCGLCALYKFCRIINHKHICPWLSH